jgi:excisionase family DNA binding protein
MGFNDEAAVEGTPPLPDLLTPAEVCAIFSVSRRTLHRWERAGILPAVRIGGTVRYRAEDARALIQKQMEASLLAACRGRVNAPKEPSRHQIRQRDKRLLLHSVLCLSRTHTNPVCLGLV